MEGGATSKRDQPEEIESTRPPKIARSWTPQLHASPPPHQSEPSQPSEASPQIASAEWQTKPTQEAASSRQATPGLDKQELAKPKETTASQQGTSVQTGRRHRVPSEPLQPQYAPTPALELEACNGWPSFYLPQRWRAEDENAKGGRWRVIDRDAAIGLHEPFPLPYERMELYIKRLARASGVDPHGREHRRFCMEQFWRFQMYNERWRRKMKPEDCKALWEAGIADRALRSKHVLVPKGEGLSKEQSDLDDEL